MVPNPSDQQLPILLVDDSLFLRNRIRSTLQQDGYRLVEAGNGRTALDAIDHQEFGCVLTDLVMPELDGFGLLTELKKRGYQRPVVVMTADVQKSTRERCQELGALTLIQKPVNLDQLRAVLSGVFGR